MIANFMKNRPKSSFRALLGCAIHAWLCALAVTCGAFQPDYINYAGDAKGTPPKTCDAAVESFSTNIEPAVDSTCANCHSTTKIDGGNLSADSASANRSVILNYTGTSAAKLSEYIGSSAHGGGIQPEPSLEKIQAWLDVEATCE